MKLLLACILVVLAVADKVQGGNARTASSVLLTEEAGPGSEELRLVVRDTKTTARKPTGGTYLLNMTGYALAMRQATKEIEADTVLDYLVATQKPYYHEVRMGGPITDDQIRQFAGVVEAVGASIKAGRFVPNGLVSGACSWCGFRQICPAYQET